MEKLLNIIQLIFAGLLVVVILFQQRGTGLSSAFGGSGGETYFKKRGAEKILFIATITLAILFVASSIVRMIVLK